MTDYTVRRENELQLRLAQLEAQLRKAQADRYIPQDPTLAASARRIADEIIENVALREALERARGIAVALEQECAACPNLIHQYRGVIEDYERDRMDADE